MKKAIKFEVWITEEVDGEITEQAVYEREAELKQSICSHLEMQYNCINSVVVKVKVIAHPEVA